nr:hybrid signal transduction histidine kinase M [Tanacetum cinerariifolium]
MWKTTPRQLDDLIKMWILSSLCDSLQEQVVTAPGNAKALWDHLKDLFHDNKDTRAINLDNELRSIKIGTMTVNEYCTKIRSMADHLKNLGCDLLLSNCSCDVHVLYTKRPSYNSTAGPTAFYTGSVHYSSQPHPLVHQPAEQAQFLQPQSAHQPGILGQPPSQATTLPSTFSTMTLQDPTWNMDTGLSSHLNSNASNLRTIFNQRLFPSVHVGDGNSIPVINTGHCTIPSAHRPLHLHNVLVTPNIIKNLIYVCQFTRDNNCTIEFDAFGFSVKISGLAISSFDVTAQAISIQLPSRYLSILHLLPRVPLHGTNASVTPGMTCFVLY